MAVRKLLKVASTLVGLTGAFFFTAWATSYRPEPLEHPDIVTSGTPKPLRRGEVITLVSWNLQYAGSRKHHFFYDGGKAARVPPQDVQDMIQAITSTLQEINPDIALLQEIDRDSERTQRIDQLERYVQALKPAAWTSTPYHKVPYLPVPTHEMLGRVETHLGILSQFALKDADRIALAMLNEVFYRQWFNIKRCIQAVSLPIEGGGTLRLANTHLSAFSYGDGTLPKQVATVADWMGKDQSFILGGDFNLLPPGDDPKRLTVESDAYADAVNPIEALTSRFKTSVPPDKWLDPAYRTYLPFGHEEPDRMIDYVFHGDDVEVVSVEVLRKFNQISDHLPVVVKFRLK